MHCWLATRSPQLSAQSLVPPAISPNIRLKESFASFPKPATCATIPPHFLETLQETQQCLSLSLPGQLYFLLASIDSGRAHQNAIVAKVVRIL